VAIDDEEMHRLRGALEHVFGPGSFLGLIVLQSNPRGRTIDSFFATTHEYALLFAPNPDQAEVHPLPLTDDQAADFSLQDKTSDYRLLPFRRSGGLSTPAERPNSEYPIFYDPVSGRIDVEDFMGAMRIMPTDRDGRRRVWRQTRPSLLAAVARGDIVIKERESKFTVYMKDRIKYGRKPKSIWNDPKYDASSHGTVLLQNILGERRLFSYPKSLNAVIDSIRTLLGNSEAPVVLDFFAGSGTTGHAVIALNRDDGLARKFILVEMGHYFDTVLLPRIKCITYSPEWKAGRPSRAPSQEEMDNGPRLVKYLRIESYEDTLNNIAFSGQGGQETLGLFDDYLLSYMLEWETKESDTLLNVEKLATPFAYKLLIAEDGETKEKQVDLPETFNYLLGLRVRSRKVYSDKGRAYLVYRGKADGRQVAVIWRETKDWKAADFERDKKYVAEQKLTEGADEIFVNSDSVIPGAKSLDPVFKARMFAPVAAGNRGN
jgi:adenine-specific DNA-methyltransferase